MSKKINVAVEQAFIERFGPWAGWAHNTLFISELASQKDRLPAHLQAGAKVKPKTALKAPQLDPPAGIDEQAALELRSVAASDNIVAESKSAKKRRLIKRGPKTATGKVRDQALAAESSIKVEDGAAATNVTSHGSCIGPPEEKVSPRGRRTRSKLRATRSMAAPSGKIEQNKTSGSVDYIAAAAAAAVDQAVEDGAKPPRS